MPADQHDFAEGADVDVGIPQGAQHRIAQPGKEALGLFLQRAAGDAGAALVVADDQREVSFIGEGQGLFRGFGRDLQAGLQSLRILVVQRRFGLQRGAGQCDDRAVEIVATQMIVAR